MGAGGEGTVATFTGNRALMLEEPLIFELGGTLSQFTGDGMMVFFNDPIPCQEPERRAVELGYRDFRYMLEDRDLDSVRQDPRFRQLLNEYEIL